MAKGYRVAAFGGPEVMVWQSLDLGELAPGSARVRVGASGINFAETHWVDVCRALPDGVEKFWDEDEHIVDPSEDSDEDYDSSELEVYYF